MTYADSKARIVAHVLGDTEACDGEDRYVWLVADPDDDLTIVSCSDYAPYWDSAPDTDEYPRDWLEFELDMLGWDWLLGVGGSGGDEVATFLAREGLAPGQPFLVWLSPHYSTTNTDWGYEYDLDVDMLVVAREPLSIAEAATRWQRWIDAGYEKPCDRI